MHRGLRQHATLVFLATFCNRACASERYPALRPTAREQVTELVLWLAYCIEFWVQCIEFQAYFWDFWTRQFGLRRRGVASMHHAVQYGTKETAKNDLKYEMEKR